MSTGIEPHSVGRYQVVSELGRGAMGVVFKAIDPNIGRTVALKTLRLDALGIDSEEVVRRFKNEARSAGVMNHPNIVTIFDAGEIHGIFYIAMEFIEGTTLQSLMAEQKVLPVDRIITLCRQICVGLDYAHSQGVIHRDVKPANMMITSDGTVKIMDFGIAKAGGGMTSTGQVLGTPNYMSPEQVKGRILDGRSDLFSLGVMIYEMITGEKPFMGQNITTIIYKIVNENPISPRELDVTVHPGLSAVVTRALAKSPDERYQSGAELMRDLENYKNLAGGASAGSAAGAATIIMPALVNNQDQTEVLANTAGIPDAQGQAGVSPGAHIAHPAGLVAGSGAAQTGSDSPTLDQADWQAVKAAEKAGKKSARPAPKPAPKVTSKPRSAGTSAPFKIQAATQRYALIALALLVVLGGWAMVRRSSKKSPGQVAASQPTPAPSSASVPPAATQPANPQGNSGAASTSSIASPATPGAQNAQVQTPAQAAMKPTAIGQISAAPAAAINPGAPGPGAPASSLSGQSATRIAPVSTKADTMAAADKKAAAALATRNRNLRQIAKNHPDQPGTLQPENPVLAATNAMGMAGLTGMSVASTPEGVKVAIDGVSQPGWRTPFQTGKLAPGRHSVSFSKPGYTDESRAVLVLPGKMASVGVQMKPKVALVSIASSPSGAAVLLDGKATSRLTPTEIAVEHGDHTLTLKLAGYKDTTFRATIGEVQSYSFKPKMVKEGPPPAPNGGPNPFSKIGRFFGGGIPQGKGRLSIRTTPSGAEITVEGHPAPKKTPAKFPIDPGTYQVTLILPGYKPLHKTVTVQEGKTSEIQDSFEAQ